MKLLPWCWTENDWALNQKFWVNVPIQYFEIYNQYRYNFLYSNSWIVLPRPAMSTTALVLNWKWLPLFQFLICSETHTLVLNWKWLGFESLGKFEWMYPFNTLKFTIIYNQYGYNFLYSNSWFVVELTNLTLSRVLPRPSVGTTALVLNWKWLPLFQFLICSKIHALVLNWKWLGFESLGKFERMYPLNTLKFSIR